MSRSLPPNFNHQWLNCTIKNLTYDRTTFANPVLYLVMQFKKKKKKKKKRKKERKIRSISGRYLIISQVFFEKTRIDNALRFALARATKISSTARISESRKTLPDSLYSGRQENFRDGLFAFPPLPKNSNETFPTGELFAKGLAAFTASLIRLYNHRKTTRRRVHSHDSAFTSAGTLAVYYCRYRESRGGSPIRKTSVLSCVHHLFFHTSFSLFSLAKNHHQQPRQLFHSAPLLVFDSFRDTFKRNQKCLFAANQFLPFFFLSSHFVFYILIFFVLLFNSSFPNWIDRLGKGSVFHDYVHTIVILTTIAIL